MSLPRNRPLYRVEYWYFTQADEWKKTTSILLTEPAAQAEAIRYNAENKIPVGREAVYVIDQAAVAEYESEKAQRRLATKRGA